MSEKLSFIMINGTEGKPEYAVFARRGNMIAAFKPQTMHPAKGEYGKVSFHLHVRIRLTPIVDEFGAEYTPAETFKYPDEAWPEFKVATKAAVAGRIYASQHFMSEVPIDEDIKSEDILALEDKCVLTKKLAEDLATQFGEDYMLFTTEQLTGLIHELYGPVFEKVKNKVKETKEIEDNGGVTPTDNLAYTKGSKKLQALKEKFGVSVPEVEDKLLQTEAEAAQIGQLVDFGAASEKKKTDAATLAAMALPGIIPQETLDYIKENAPDLAAEIASINDFDDSDDAEVVENDDEDDDEDEDFDPFDDDDDNDDEEDK